MSLCVTVHSHCCWVFCASLLLLMAVGWLPAGALPTSAAVSRSACIWAWLFLGHTAGGTAVCGAGTFPDLLNDFEVFHSGGPSPSTSAVRQHLVTPYPWQHWWQGGAWHPWGRDLSGVMWRGPKMSSLLLIHEDPGLQAATSQEGTFPGQNHWPLPRSCSLENAEPVGKGKVRFPLHHTQPEVASNWSVSQDPDSQGAVGKAS